MSKRFAFHINCDDKSTLKVFMQGSGVVIPVSSKAHCMETVLQ